ncbi:MAG: hypothetical protein IPP22_13845 [Nitrosomonas sp.]|nr:hypothetical protein [Nitrosomonas sp.]
MIGGQEKNRLFLEAVLWVCRTAHHGAICRAWGCTVYTYNRWSKRAVKRYSRPYQRPGLNINDREFNCIAGAPQKQQKRNNLTNSAVSLAIRDCLTEGRLSTARQTHDEQIRRLYLATRLTDELLKH